MTGYDVAPEEREQLKQDAAAVGERLRVPAKNALRRAADWVERDEYVKIVRMNSELNAELRETREALERAEGLLRELFENRVAIDALVHTREERDVEELIRLTRRYSEMWDEEVPAFLARLPTEEE